MAKENLVLVEKTGARGLTIPANVEQSHPWVFEAEFSPPEFMEFTFICLHGGTERVKVRGVGKEDLDEFIGANHFDTHPRFRQMTITGPGGSLLVKRGEKYPLEK
jgi:hypothetical protein